MEMVLSRAEMLKEGDSVNMYDPDRRLTYHWHLSALPRDIVCVSKALRHYIVETESTP